VNSVATPAGSSFAALGRFFFRYRDALFPIVLLGLAALWRPSESAEARRTDLMYLGAGAALALTGQAFRVLVIGLSYITRGGQNLAAYAERLVQDGMFGHCRNPLYVGNTCIQVGVLLAVNEYWAYLIGLPFIALVYGSIVSSEEQFLVGRFGDDYRQYCARVPRFALRLASVRATLSRAPFDWLRVVRKDYGTPFAWISAMIAIGIYKEARTVGFDVARPVIPSLLVIWTVSLVGYLTARVLKKAGRLGSDTADTVVTRGESPSRGDAAGRPSRP